ncbi:MAG: calcium-binding protein, partial [Betaproteobacteria bacterium]
MENTPVTVWTQLIGSKQDASATALTTGLDGSIYVSGLISGSIDGQTNAGGSDAFVTKYSSDGVKAWTRLLGTSGYDTAT